MDKEKILEEIVKITEKINGTFRWESLYRISKRELIFLVEILGKTKLFEMTLLDIMNDDKDKLKKKLLMIAKKNGIDIEEVFL